MIKELKDKTITLIDSQSIVYLGTMHVETIQLDEMSLDSPYDYHHGFKLFYDEEWELQYGYYWIQELVPNKERVHYRETYLSDVELRAVVQWLTKEEQTSQIVREYQVKFPKDPNKGKMIDL